MEKIEIGEYVRTKSGIIDKVIIDYFGICNSPNCNCKHVTCQYDYYDEEDIVKHSKDIIDLIEPGDMVEDTKQLQRINNIEMLDRFKSGDAIKSILTKEMYEQNCYRLEKQ